MPACASEGFGSATRFRSSSPPNSRSNSASPPLTWPASLATANPGSPGQTSPVGNSFKRTISNLSNSSISRTYPTVTEQPSSTCVPATDATDAILSFAERHSTNHRTRDLDDDETHENTIRHDVKIATTTARIFGRPRNRDKRITSNPNDTINPEDESKTRRSRRNYGFSLPGRILVWYVNLVLTLVRKIHSTLSYLIWAPVIWTSTWICVFWTIVQLPLNTINWIIMAICTSASERSRDKRCVLINGGSTLQALHLARNFYKAGARVIVCEIDGLFGLARFSTACSRFYTLPRPGPNNAAEYVNALRNIVKKENVAYYVPVSCTVDAYYDALAKPHLEIQGCECFVPGTAEVTALEDPLQLIKRCNSLGLATPTYYVVKSPDDLGRLYEAGKFTGNDRHVMMSAGPAGMRERTKLIVPNCPGDGSFGDLRRKLENYEINERRPWIVLREPTEMRGGHQLVTCTTIKNSRVVANVTCRLDEARGLVPEDRSDVDQWIDAFFARPFANDINGHVSFKMAHFGDDGVGLVALGCRVGVPLPYLCLTSVHPRLVWRPCRHFSRQNSANHLMNDRYKQNSHQTGFTSSNGLTGGIRSTGTSTVTLGQATNGLIVPRTTVLDNRDALFVYWDPLPYCAYYHLQLPFRRLAGAIGQRPAQHKPPLAVVR